MRDERGLIKRAQRNDPEAFAEIYEELYDKIYRYIFHRVRNQTEAEDLTQEVFLNAMKSISSYKWRGAPFSSWLFRIAHNRVVDYWRRAARIRITALDVPVAASDPEPPGIADREMDMERIREAIPRLTQLQQEVISLRFAGELSTAETAQVMGKSQGAVKVLQHSALVALRKLLSEEGDHDQEA